MCNPMHVPRNELIVQVIKNHLGEKRHMDEWISLINSSLPSQMRETRKSLSLRVPYLGKKLQNDGICLFNKYVEKLSVFYEFSDILPQLK